MILRTQAHNIGQWLGKGKAIIVIGPPILCTVSIAFAEPKCA